MPLNPGELVNRRYRIVKILGQGGFGAVYRAWDTSFNMPCALKENLETRPDAQRQFEREARMLRGMKHTNLPLVTDYFTVPGKGQYLVMDYIEGEDIEEIVAQTGGPAPVSEAIDWICQVCDALTYLHTQKPAIIHRDIKPANIRITRSSTYPNGQAILVDFGIAKEYDPGLKTTTGARALTPGYAPYEQYGQGHTDARTDLYALGATLYTLLTGERPVESVQRMVQDGLVPPEQYNPNIPLSLAVIINHAMAMDPALRYQSAGEFKQALMSVGNDGQTVIARTQVADAVRPASALAIIAPAQGRTGLNARLERLGLFGGIGIFAILLVLLSVAAAVFGFSWIYREYISIEPTPRITALTLPAQENTSIPGISTETAPSGLEHTLQTPATNPTGTFFAQIEKPADIPVIPSADQMQVYQLEPSGGEMNIVITFLTDASVEEVIAYYEEEMLKNGWNKVNTYTDSQMLVLYYQKDTRLAQVMITQSSGRSLVSISVMEQ